MRFGEYHVSATPSHNAWKTRDEGSTEGGESEGKKGKLTNSSHYWSQVWGLKHLQLFIGVVQGQDFLAKPHFGDFHSYHIIKSVEAAAPLCFWH